MLNTCLHALLTHTACLLAQVIVNTCAFVEDAKRESIATIVDAAHLKDDDALPTRGLFVTG